MEWQKEVKKNDSFTDKNHACSGGSIADGKTGFQAEAALYLGWLLAGMLVGPHGLRLMDSGILDALWYQNTIHVLECAVGLMIGTELVWSRIRKSGKAIMITTLTQSLGTFILVSAVFAVLFSINGISVYLAFVFGGIALATAPAPALSIVKEFKTDGRLPKP